MVKTKIICTIGPSSGNVTVLRNMMLAGMDVGRLNFSYRSHASHKHHIDLIRELNRKYRRHIKILQDLEGYRIRVGKFKNGQGVELKKRQQVLLTNQDLSGEKNIIPLDYQGLLSDVRPGTHIYIDDGNIALVVKSRLNRYLRAEVVNPGFLKENKGVNIPKINLRFKGLTNKDRIDIQFGIKNKVDYIAQSFVRNRNDIIQIIDLVKPKLPDCKIVAKIENPQGIKNIDEIIDVSDGIMIARGDMGISIPIYKIPVVQKMIIRKCNRRKKFVITATQMLENMVENIRPTRAEVTDVANAVLDGTDFVMLSAETAIGKHPVESVRMMNQILKFTEDSGKENAV
ncbi:pyruvate kinase [bacterium]|nr:pyruvate kinase [bacterium]NIN91422.1 pyruvate kinase [bacterium]NIO17832.1 pyruvate kinase [bacterium]NIO72813.1 pyruvate kinase [bacterium]